MNKSMSPGSSRCHTRHNHPSVTSQQWATVVFYCANEMQRVAHFAVIGEPKCDACCFRVVQRQRGGVGTRFLVMPPALL